MSSSSMYRLALAGKNLNQSAQLEILGSLAGRVRERACCWDLWVGGHVPGFTGGPGAGVCEWARYQIPWVGLVMVSAVRLALY